MAEKKGIGLLKYLDCHPERRCDGGKIARVEIGRFKYFRQVSKASNSPMLTANLLFLISALPAIAVLILVQAYGGTESIAYRAFGISETPYLMSGVGFGLSECAYSVLDVESRILKVWHALMAALGLCAFGIVVAFGGLVAMARKFVHGDSFVTKKDSYGNDVPRGAKEYLIGVKATWKEMTLAGAIALALVAGFGNFFVWFVGLRRAGAANAGHWISAILVSCAILLSLMFCAHYVPTVALFDMPLKSKVKNSLVYAIVMFAQTLAVVVALALPFAIALLLRNFVSIVIAAIFLCYGGKWHSLLLCNYEQYLAENITTPAYEAASSKRSSGGGGKKRQKR